jgi:hypothetical protein
MGGMMTLDGGMLLGLVPVSAGLAALLAQPFRALGWPGWRVVLTLLAPMAVLAQLGAARALVPAALGSPLVAGLLLAVLALLMLPLAVLAAMLLARPEPAGLAQALAGVGVSPVALAWRLRLPALLPGLALGWVAGCLGGVAALLVMA